MLVCKGILIILKANLALVLILLCVFIVEALKCFEMANPEGKEMLLPCLCQYREICFG
jgi:hypothetical protein